MPVARDLQGAIELAARILEEMGVREPPVPDSFIDWMDPSPNVRVVVEPLRRGTRGATMLSPDGAEWWVVLNANDRYPVRRFTLAHEAFHIACGTGLAFRRDGCGEFYECSLADHFREPSAGAGRLVRRCSIAYGPNRGSRMPGFARGSGDPPRVATSPVTPSLVDCAQHLVCKAHGSSRNREPDPQLALRGAE
ncbi:MAG: hypothetical protein ACM3S1_02025 [Hyphomicrobiales bacterium]